MFTNVETPRNKLFERLQLLSSETLLNNDQHVQRMLSLFLC